MNAADDIEDRRHEAADAYGCAFEYEGPCRYGLLIATSDGDRHMDTYSTIESAVTAASNTPSEPGDWWPCAIVDLDTGFAYEVRVNVSVVTEGPLRNPSTWRRDEVEA